MPHCILQPCGDKEAREHYKDTIVNTVDLQDVRRYVTIVEYEDLLSIYPEKRVKVWGVTPGKGRSANAKRWKKIQAGDVALLAAKGHIFASATVTYKTHNIELAKFLWGKNLKDQTWEYIYFVSEVETQDIPYKALNAVIPYAENYVIQGFSVLDQEKSNNVLEAFDLFSDIFYPDIEIDGDYNFLQELESLEAASKVNRRKEQSILRRLLFRNKPYGRCCICSKDFPVSFLVAAHIKKRSECTSDEKRDFQNIVAPMCRFGCDELYEQGYVGVKNGFVVSFNTKDVSDPVKQYLGCIVDNVCSSWHLGTKEYFSWHIRRHQKI